VWARLPELPSRRIQRRPARSWPLSLLATNGIESDTTRTSVISLPTFVSAYSKPAQRGSSGVGSAFIGGNAYLYHYFKKAWWSGTKAPHFFFHADWDQWFRDQDKSATCSVAIISPALGTPG